MHSMFKMLMLSTTVVLSLAPVTVTQARDVTLTQPYRDVLSLPDANERLDPSVRLFFGDQRYPDPTSTRGDYFVDRSANSIVRTEVGACRAIALDNLVTLQERARAIGANAVVNIVSDFKQQERHDADTYTCRGGNFTANVALKGTMVTLPE